MGLEKLSVVGSCAPKVFDDGNLLDLLGQRALVVNQRPSVVLDGAAAAARLIRHVGVATGRRQYQMLGRLLKKSPEMKDRLGACVSDWAGAAATSDRRDKKKNRIFPVLPRAGQPTGLCARPASPGETRWTLAAAPTANAQCTGRRSKRRLPGRPIR
ncbi:hypothetical protein DAPPUDRAFT_99951 [Daphnia pulex]|uniref:Uncharacterized protein n=1 Tax=Daphnia pulex TaxID=6669 RepID=E9G8U5_DAPPU|nr:hypothetical protein DAPPUDRAFT_99951 [Daphnia pulex]|eukprot:EFX84036.1 hypothetical protein DAPPUDRAFT_99951 [Daphnia pulex]